MSPEQARGQDVDKRSDIWSYGCVLYEMLTGRRAFSGETASDTIAAILTAVPNWEALPPSASPDFRRLLRRCLEKDRKLRLRDIGEARVELEEARLRSHFMRSSSAAGHFTDGLPGASAPAGSGDVRSAVTRYESLAVLALNDRAGLEYLSDGIAEALTYRLTMIQGITRGPLDDGAGCPR
jgi:serine/threonine protein kinase